MGRSSRLLLAVAVIGVLAANVCFAGLPDPALSTAGNVILSPNASIDYVVEVIGSEGPIDTALVQIVFSTETDGLVCWCTGQVHPNIEGYTNALGQATFNLAGGGCVDSSLVSTPPAVEVFANGIKIAEVGVVSPDAVDGLGRVPTDPGYDPMGSCTVGVGDAANHTGPIVTSTYSFCTDLNSDGALTLADAVLVSEDIINSASCTAQ